MNKIFIYSLLALLIINIKVQADTLDKALINVLETNPKILSGQKYTQSIFEDSNLSGVVYRPRMSLVGSVGHNQSRTTVYSKYSPSSIGINLNQTIFDGYKGKYEIQKSKEDFYKAEFEQISLEQLIFLDAIKVYIDLLYNIDLLELKTKNENIIEEELKSANISFIMIDIKKSDLLLAEAIYKKAIIDISDINKNIINLKTTFKNEIQMEAVDLSVPIINFNYIPNSIDEAILIAKLEHPRILLNQHIINSGNLNTKIIESEKYPQVNLNANYSKSWNPLSNVKQSDTLSVAGTVTIPLYDSGLIDSKIRKSSFLENKYNYDAIQVKNKVIEDVTINWNSIKSLNDAILSENNFLLVNMDILEAVKEERNNGISSNLDFLNAQSSVIDTKIRLSKHQFDKLYYSYKLLSSIGRLNLNFLLN